MKKFFRHIAFFSIPFIIGVAGLFSFPLNKQFAYHFLENDCYNHGTWIYDRVFQNDRPIDIAFIGTSATIQAVYEQKIESILDSTYQSELKLANLGYCRPGRNLHYVLLKDLLENKKINTLILEVRDDEDRYSHPVFPNLADADDVLAPALLFNRDIFSDCLKAIATRFEYRKRALLLMNPAEHEQDENPFGYGAGTRIAPSEELVEAFRRRNKADQEISMFQRNFYMKFPRTYISKIATLCQSKDVKMIFLYLKAYGSPQNEPKELTTYQKHGEVWLPPKEIFEKPENWMDPDHLNINGASKLAGWLAKEIDQTIQ